jgi:hypothetical protein
MQQSLKYHLHIFAYLPIPFILKSLFTERLKRPAPATASRQVAVADRGAVSVSVVNKQERRRFSRSFTTERNEAVIIGKGTDIDFNAVAVAFEVMVLLYDHCFFVRD